MSLNYKFQDLAKFIDDVKFLLSSGGGLFPGGIANKSLPEIILRIIWIFILWIFIFVLVYIVYKIIFKGYPRFPLDLLRLNFYKKVDVKSSVGDPNGLLYDSINDLSSEEMKDALGYLSKSGHNFFVEVGDKNTTVFQQVKDAIIKEYSPEYNTDGAKEALSDYYKYFEQISENLDIKGQSSASKTKKLQTLYNEVFLNYIRWYMDEILSKEMVIQCVLNNGKTDEKRNEIKERRKGLANEYKALLKRTDCKKIDTTCEFAKLFVDPGFSLQCPGDNKNLIDKWLKALGYEKPRLRYRQLEREIRNDKRFLGAKLPKPKKRAKERIRWKTEEQKKLKIQMIDIQKEAIAKAQAEAKTVSLPKVDTATYKDIITYDTPARIAPNTSRVKADSVGTQYTVFVPCYSLYKHYYDVHRDTMFKSLDKSMSVDEIVAYIFLTDIEKIMENAEVEKQIQRLKGIGSEDTEQLPVTKPTLIGKFLQIHMAIESMSGTIEGALMDTKTPMAHLQYITFPDQDTITGSITELIKFNKDVVPLYSDGSASGVTLKDYVKNAAKLSSCKYDYTYYLMEVFSYFANIDNGAHTLYDLYVFIISSTEFNKNSLITFLNLPSEQQKDVRNLEKFKISKELLLFLRQHPIFTLVYLSENGQGSRDKYVKVMQMFVNMLEDKPSMLEKARDVERLSVEEARMIIQHIEKKALGLKKVNVCLHMIHLYFSRYRDSLHERDSITKNKISRDGFVDIYNQHNISYEFGSFFKRLFEPFKYEFIDGRIKASWKKAFYGPRFNPDLKRDKRNISYWRDFNAFWIDYMGKKMDEMMKGWWKNFKNYTKAKF